MNDLRVILLAFLFPPLSAAHEAHHMGHVDPGAATAVQAEVTVLDHPMVNDATKVMSLPDAVRRKPASVLGFFYSRCDASCPITTTLLQGVMKQLPEAERARIQVILITLDPATDTPKVLTEYRRKMNVPDDWLLLTGTPADVNQILLGLGAYANDLENHPPQLLVRAERESGFVRLFGVPEARSVRQALGTR